MKVRIARIAKRMHNKFRGLYWRQMFVTVGMVLLTLFLLGVSFFSLSYNYARGQENGELAAQAQVVGQLSASYLENGRYLDMEELQHEEDFQRLASFAATVSEVDFLICDVEGHVLLSTDASLSGLVVTMPEEMTAEVLEEGISSRRTDVDGLYSNKRFVVGVPAISEDTPDPVGMVYAVSSTTSLDTMWSGFIGLFFMTAFVVLMISFTQTTELPDGRRILIAWMKSWDACVIPEEQKWQGMMTLPRELHYVNGKLYQKPVEELKNYRKNSCRLENQEVSGTC